MRARQSSALNWVLFTVVSPLFTTRIKYIQDVLSTGKKEESRVYCTFSHFAINREIPNDFKGTVSPGFWWYFVKTQLNYG